MNYPKEQFEKLKECIKKLAPICDLKKINANSLHYICYQQITKEDQGGNKLYIFGNEMKRYGNLTEEEKLNFVKFIEIEYDFKLYPIGCNDLHIETAVKSALKDLGLN